MKIIVNGTTRDFVDGTISYEKACELAGKDPTTSPTVTYSYRGKQGGGELHTGSTPIWAEQGMIISCIHTGNA